MTYQMVIFTFISHISQALGSVVLYVHINKTSKTMYYLLYNCTKINTTKLQVSKSFLQKNNNNN